MSFFYPRFVFVFTGSFLLLMALSAGCTPTNRVSASPTVPSRSGSPSVASLPEYQAAQLAFSRKDFGSAKAQLTALQKRPGLSSADTVFLTRQIALCESALMGKKPSVGASSLVSPSSSPKRSSRVKSPSDCGPRALALVCARQGKPQSVATLSGWAGTTKDGTTLSGLKKAAVKAGFVADGVQVDKTALSQLPTPSIAWVSGDHYVVVEKVSPLSATVRDPNQVSSETWTTEKLLRQSGGIVLRLQSKEKKKKG